MIDHPHGTSARYAHGTSTEPPCRERCCLDAHNADQRNRARLRAYGRSSMTDAGPVRAHVETLFASGVGAARIAKLAGVSARSVRVLLGQEATLPPSRQVRVTTAEKLLVVRPTLDDLAARSPVPVHGTRRRLQALVVSGRPLTFLAAESGVAYSVVHDIVHGRRSTVRAHTARAVRDLTERWWDQPPPQRTQVERDQVKSAQRLAAKHQWVPLACFDDVEDPDEQPKGAPKQKQAAA